MEILTILLIVLAVAMFIADIATDHKEFDVMAMAMSVVAIAAVIMDGTLDPEQVTLLVIPAFAMMLYSVSRWMGLIRRG